MERRKIGHARRKAPVIRQGTWHIETGRHDAAVAALRRGLDPCMAHIDAALPRGPVPRSLAMLQREPQWPTP